MALIILCVSFILLLLIGVPVAFAIGLGSVFMHLKAEINWYRLFHELITGFDVRALDRRQKAALKDAGLKKQR